MTNERTRNQHVSAGPDAYSDDSGSVAVSEGNVEVVYGVHAHAAPLAGMTVRRARNELAERLNLDPEATPVVDGNEVDDDTVLAENQVLTFVKHMGEKG